CLTSGSDVANRNVSLLQSGEGKMAGRTQPTKRSMRSTWNRRDRRGDAAGRRPEGHTTTIVETATAAAEQVEDAQADVEEPQALEEIVADKGYHSNQTMIDLDAVAIRSYIAE